VPVKRPRRWRFCFTPFPFPLHSLAAEQSFARYSTVMESLSFWTQSYIVGSSPSWIRRWVSPPILLLLPLFLHSDPPLNVVLSLPHHSFYFSMISHLFNPPRPPLPIPKCNFRFFFFILHVKVLLSPVIEEVLLPAQYMTITRTLSPNPLIDFYFSNFYSLNGFIRIEFVQCRACYDAHPDTYSHNDNHYRSKMNETKWPDWNNVEKNRFCLFCGSNRSIKIIKFSKSSSNSSSNFSILKEIRMNKTFPIWPCFNDFL